MTMKMIGTEPSLEYRTTLRDYQDALSTFEQDSKKLEKLKLDAKSAESEATELHSAVKRSMEVKHAYDSQLKERLKNLRESIADMQQNVQYRKQLVKQGFVAGGSKADEAVIFTTGGNSSNSNANKKSGRRK